MRVHNGLLAALATGVLATASISSASAADLGGNCCADLEERIAELEATTARKGNRKVSLQIYGVVNEALLFWDDGKESNTYIGTPGNYPTTFGFTGDATIAPGWKAGYKIEIQVGDFLYGHNQVTDESASPKFLIWQSNWFIESEKYGRLTMGTASRVTDLAPEQDLSKTTDATYSLVSDIGFSFGLRRNDGNLSALLWGQIAGYNMTGETGAIVRYDSPAISGFTLALSYGEDDMSEVGLFYSHEGGGFAIAAAVAYARSTDENGLAGALEFPGPPQTNRFGADTVTGSFSILHQASGLNLTIAAGNRDFDDRTLDNDGVVRSSADSSYIWAKLGWITKLNHLGDTAFYGEYGWYEDGVSVGFDNATIASLAANGNADCATAGQACRITGSDANIWGIGVVQYIDAAEMTMYLGYRQWDADVDLVDVNGNSVRSSGIEKFHHVIFGSRIAF